jgi:2-haloacid dehalogenase
MQTQLQAIVFDFGGVLINWNPRHLYRKLFNDDAPAMENFLTEVGFKEWNEEQDRGRPFAIAVMELCEKFPHYSAYITAYDQRWRESIAGEIAGTVEILRTLKQAGYALYGLSNWSAETFQRVRHEFEFFGWFDLIVLSGEEKLIKPDPQIFQVLLNKTGRTAQECVFIDDSAPNILVANQLGFVGIHFESPEQLEAELRTLNILQQTVSG